VLLIATLGAVGYLYLSRGGNSSAATGFVGANQESVKAIDTVVAGRAQRLGLMEDGRLTVQARSANPLP